MNGALEFFIGALVVLTGWFGWSTRKMTWKEKKEYFKSPDGKGILKGIFLAVTIPAIIIGLVLLLGGCSGTFNNGASVYAGLDYTKKESPMCDPVDPDSHTTSNLGLKYFLYESEDGTFKLNTKYTHHSCAFSPDDRQYDAVGVELEYMIPTGKQFKLPKK